MTPAMIPAVIDPTVATILGALITAGLAYLAVRGTNRTKRLELAMQEQQKKADKEVEAREREQTNRNTSYDQLQEDLSALRVELAAVKKADSEEIAAVRSELAEVKKSAAEETQGVRRGLALSQRRERILEGHVWDLRRHIERGEGPPPPPYPPELEIPA